MTTENDVPMEEQETNLVDAEQYLKAGIHVGTKFKTEHMKPFIYKTRPDGLAVLNVQSIDNRLELAFNLVSQYKPEDIIVVCRRENGWQPLEIFKKMTGVPGFAGRYPPGILTNSNLEDFVEAKVMVVIDPWADKNAIADALKVGLPVIALCDTNNQCNNIDLVVPCNNKGRKSLGLFFYLFARQYMLKHDMIKSADEMEFKLEDFMED